MKCRTCGGPVKPNKDGIRVCQKCGEMYGREAPYTREPSM